MKSKMAHALLSGVIAGGLVVGFQAIDPPRRPVTLAVPMPGHGLPACASEDDAPVGGCVWSPGDGPVWINYPGRA
jgi:hypothetical protein